jgi:hypothetical protein
MTAAARVDFVSDNLQLLIAAANRKIDAIDRADDLITIRTGEIQS